MSRVGLPQAPSTVAEGESAVSGLLAELQHRMREMVRERRGLQEPEQVTSLELLERGAPLPALLMREADGAADGKESEGPSE